MVRERHNMDEMLQDLKSGDWEKRFRATELLGKLRRSRAVKPLMEALKDEDEYVREGAAWALGEVGRKIAVEPLIEACGIRTGMFVREPYQPWARSRTKQR